MNESTGLYSGSIGRIQRGEADTVAMPIYFPLHDPDGKYFDYSKPLFEDKMMIGSAYNYSEEYVVGDIMNMFSSISYDYWLSAISSLFVFSMLMSMSNYIRYRMRICREESKILRYRKKYIKRIPKIELNGIEISESNVDDGNILTAMKHATISKPTSSYWKVFGICLKQIDIQPRSRSQGIVISMLLIFSLFFTSFILNCMSTDMVTVKDPIVISSYRDILDRNVSIIWPPFLPEELAFKESDDGTIQKQLWNQRSAMPKDPISIGYMFREKIATQRVAGIMREPIVRAFCAFALYYADQLQIKEQIKSIRGLLSFDPGKCRIPYVHII